MLTSIVVCLCVAYVSDIFFEELQVNYIWLLITVFICSIVSILGDLIASVIKRNFGIKDFGNVIPGHGGIMDRFDSVMFAAPALYLFIVNSPIFFKGILTS